MLNACEPCVYVHNVPCNVCAGIDAHVDEYLRRAFRSRSRAYAFARLAKTTRERVPALADTRCGRGWRSAPPLLHPPWAGVLGARTAKRMLR